MTGPVHHLAEGIGWDDERAALVWVDIEAGAVHEAAASPIDEALDAGLPATGLRHRASHSVGFAVPGPGGTLLLGAENRLVALDAGGVRPVGPELFEIDGDRRINDGGCDLQGRPLVGTMRRGPGEGPPREDLLRIEPDGSVTTLRTGLMLANGLAFTPDGRLFHVDSTARTIAVCEDPADGTRWQTAWRLAEDDGLPDGMCADVEGYLWVAIWGRGEVRRYSPDGSVHAIVSVPDAPHTSSAAFVGPDLDILVITTAQEGLSEEKRRRHPLSGSIFVAHPGVRGVPVPRWSGTP